MCPAHEQRVFLSMFVFVYLTPSSRSMASSWVRAVLCCAVLCCARNLGFLGGRVRGMVLVAVVHVHACPRQQARLGAGRAVRAAGAISVD